MGSVSRHRSTLYESLAMVPKSERLLRTLDALRGGTKKQYTLANLPTSQASCRLLGWLYEGIPLPKVLQPNQTQPKRTRIEEIRQRYATGGTLISIAKDYEISKQRVHQIVTRE